MIRLASVLFYLGGVAFLALGAATVRSYLQRPTRSQAYLVFAVGSLSVVAVLDRMSQFVHASWVESATGALFMLAAYALLLFRHSFLPVSRRLRHVAFVALVAAAICLAIAANHDLDRMPRGLLIGAFSALGVWIVIVTESVVRFWIAARDRPFVQRGRMRAISIGYASVIVLLFAETFGESARPGSIVDVLVHLGVLSVPLILATSFAPPRWVRRIWREPEEQALREATYDLLAHMPNEPALADKGLGRALRLVGAQEGMIVAAGGSVLAAHGDRSELDLLLGELPDRPGGLVRLDGGAPRYAVDIPLGLNHDLGRLLVIAGPFTPVFGSDEVERLTQYAASIAAALERQRLVEALGETTEALEREQEAVRRLRALDEMKDGFLTAVSHELRTPLTSILGFAQTLEQEEHELTPDQRHLLTSRLEVNAQRLGKLLTDLLDIDRLGRGIGSLTRRPTNIRQLVREVAADLEPDLGTRLHIEVPPMTISVDGAKVERIVENLLMNATRHTPAGTSVWVRARPEGSGCHIIVEDDGPGIPSELRDAVFQPFQQGPQLSAHAPGVGIGLSLVARFTELHGGRAWVEDRVGGGASFHVLLPGEDVRGERAAS